MRTYDDWLPQLNTIYYHAIMQQLDVSGHMKEFAELSDRVKGFNNREKRDRVHPYMTIYMMNEYSDIPGAVRGATPKEVEVVYDSYPEDICNFIPMISAQEIGQHLLYKIMGVRGASTPEFTAAFAMDICLNVFCQGHKPEAQFRGADMPNKVV